MYFRNAIGLYKKPGGVAVSPAPTPTPTPTPTPGAATAPVITRTSTSGDNPMRWSGSYADMIPDSDYITMRWRVNGGAWNRDTDHLFTSDDFWDSEDGVAAFAWPLFAAATFPGGALVEVQEGVLRSPDPIVWGNIVSDTMAAAVSREHKRSAEIAIGFGGGAGTLPGGSITFSALDKVVLHLSILSTTNPGTVTGVTANGGALAFTKIGESDAAYYRKAHAYRLDLPVGTTILTDISVATTIAAAFNIVMHVEAIRGSTAGAPAASYFEKRTSAAPGAQDVDGALAVAANGQMLVSVGNFGNAAGTWTGATQDGEVVDAGTSVASAIAAQTTAGDVIYSNAITADLSIAVTKWNPA